MSRVLLIGAAAAAVGLAAGARSGGAEPPRAGDAPAPAHADPSTLSPRSPWAGEGVRVARLALAGGGVDWARESLGEAADYPGCLASDVGPGDGYCELALADALAGYLVTGDFDLAVVDGWPDGPTCALADQLRDFATGIPGVRGAGAVLLAGAAVEAADGCGLAGERIGSARELAPGQLGARARALLATRNAGDAAKDESPVVSSPVVVAGDVAVFGVTAASDAPSGLASLADPQEFRFPHAQGDLRVQPLDAETQAAGATGVAIPPVDVGGCETLFTAECRTVFTTASSGRAPQLVPLARGSARSLGPMLALDKPGGLSPALTELLVARVVAGRDDDGDGVFTPAFGGVNDSSAAVVGSSPVAGDARRPAMAYVGALDGMIHAVCIDGGGPCDRAGRELWAFVPRAQLPLLRDNAQRIEGSPTVADVFGDFDGDSRAEWRTVMTVHVGSRSGGGAVIALDVTKPDAPTVLWDRAASESAGAAVLGAGKRTVMGPVVVGREVRFVTVAVGGNAGTGSACTVVEAIDTVTGDPLWTWNDGASMTAGAACDRAIVPGGASAIDASGRGATMSHLFVPTAAGRLHRLEAATGASDAEPLFSFAAGAGTALQPAVYAEGESGRFIIVVSSRRVAGATSSDPVVAGVPADAIGPLDDDSVAGAGGFAAPLAGRASLAVSPTVTGGELWLVAGDSESARFERFELAVRGQPRRVGPSVEVESPLAMPGVRQGSAVVARGRAVGLEPLASFVEVGRPVEQEEGFQRATRLVWLRASGNSAP